MYSFSKVPLIFLKVLSFKAKKRNTKNSPPAFGEQL